MNIDPHVLRHMRTRPMGLPTMQDAWSGCVSWAIRKPEIVAQFKFDSGVDLEAVLPSLYYVENLNTNEMKTLALFCDWVTVNIWGVADNPKTTLVK